MMHVGIDLEQFVTDPQSSGIQRVLQQLARHWPQARAHADFVVPHRGEYLLLSPEQADQVLTLAFTVPTGAQLREAVSERIDSLSQHVTRVDAGRLLSLFGAWLLPEVSYLPSVLQRFALFSTSMPATMIGFDILPMSEPANYRLTPGVAARASEYFRLLAGADSIVCISDQTREDIWRRLRRDMALPISVAHPGGDHIPLELPPARREGPTRFLRVGTVEARKLPVEIAESFLAARRAEANAELVFVGRLSASESTINRRLEHACASGNGISWIQDATDEVVAEHIRDADIFLSLGIEGYGIPVLEAIRMGTPVVFGGTQPAAELMTGFGAERVEDLSPLGLASAFERLSEAHARDSLLTSLDPHTVPTWEQFAIGVVDGVLQA